MSVINAWVLYNIKLNTKIPLLQFQVSMTQSLLRNHYYRVDCRHPAPQTLLPMWLTESAPYPEKIETDLVYGNVKCVDQERYNHRHPLDVKHVKHHYIPTLAWKYITLNKIIPNENYHFLISLHPYTQLVTYLPIPPPS